jgi:phage shock protein E
MGLGSFLGKLVTGSSTSSSELVKNGAMVVDVRTPQEYKSGHYQGSKNIPLQRLESAIQSLKGKDVVLVCISGARAQSAQSILRNHGINAHNAGAWQNLK